MNFHETLFYITHPKAAIEAKLRQISVGMEISGPPAGSTIEEFPELPVSQAIALIHAARQAQEDVPVQ